MQDQGKSMLNELEDSELMEGLAEAVAEIAADIDEYNKLGAEASVNVELHGDALVFKATEVFALAQTIDDFRENGLNRGLDIPEWPNREHATAIGEWALAIHREKLCEDDEKFLKDFGISGGLT
jgi:hypothetical protein